MNAEKKKSFTYLGMECTPYRNLTKEEDKQGINLLMSNLHDTPEGWNWNKFYETAEKELGKEGVVDVYLVKGEERLPGSNYFFYLNSIKNYKYKKITRKVIEVEETFTVVHVNVTDEEIKLADEKLADLIYEHLNEVI